MPADCIQPEFLCRLFLQSLSYCEEGFGLSLIIVNFSVQSSRIEAPSSIGFNLQVNIANVNSGRACNWLAFTMNHFLVLV